MNRRNGTRRHNASDTQVRIAIPLAMIAYVLYSFWQDLVAEKNPPLITDDLQLRTEEENEALGVEEIKHESVGVL